MKGQTASSSYKPAKLSNGARVMVPPHIEAGTRVIVRTEDDIRRVSQELYNLMETGSRAQGRFSPA